MVHIEDHGSEFDAPIETVWKFIDSPPDHSASHTDRRNIQGAPEKDGWMRVSWEQKMGDNWVKVVSRVTTVPPVAQIVHTIEGPIAGSKFIFYYTPKGSKTGVTAVGEFQSSVIPASELEAAVLHSFETAFHEDNAAIRRMAGHK